MNPFNNSPYLKKGGLFFLQPSIENESIHRVASRSLKPRKVEMFLNFEMIKILIYI